MKAYFYIIIALLILLIGQYFYYKNQNNKLSDTIIELKEEKIKELRKVRDSAYSKIDKITIDSQKRFDSLANLPPTIKYIKYEKSYYYNRSIDDALWILSGYKYENARTATTN